MAEVLTTTDLGRRFGGLSAVRDVTMDIAAGEVHAIIGPNGAGKTTLMNLLSGDLRPTGGRIHLAGRDITGLDAPRRSHLGIGRSYQRTNLFTPFTVGENVWLAARSRRPALRFVRPAHWDRRTRDSAAAVLDRLGLGDLAGRRIADLSHGDRRRVELAMILATDPRILLLDEPMAGMGPEESRAVVDLIAGLKGDHTVVLVEHDMDAVFALADRLTVLADGRVLASGAPETVRADPAVQAAYLGTEVTP